MREDGVHCYRVGRDALALECSAELSLGLQRRIWNVTREAVSWDGVSDVTAGLQNLTLYLDAPVSDVAPFERLLLDAWKRSEAGAEVAPGALLEIPVRYGGVDGPDLAAVAGLHGLSEDEAVERHCAREYVVNFLGFAPGFAYLGGLDPMLHAPRLAVPRPRVPAGSVAIGGELTGVYPSALPGGWNLIGRTDLTLFDAAREPAALLGPGDRVRFVAIP